MSKLLTIAIPTFNRAESLDKQLGWIAQAIKGFEDDCEILVSDNCSTDNTHDVVKKWQSILHNITFKYNKNQENLGVLKNVAYCLNGATTKYVWAIGDDDPIQSRAVTYVLTKLKEQPNLSLLFLNFSGRNKLTGEPVHPPTIVGNRWFDIDSEDGCGDSKEIFAHCFEKSIGAVIFLTATVYRTDLVQRGLQIWKNADKNWIFLAYLAGYCAANGSIIVTKDIYLECIVGVSYWQKEQNSALLMQYKHIPEVLVKLEENGYSKQFCRRMIVNNLQQVNLKVLLGAFRRWPLFTIKTLVPFLALVAVSTFELMTLKNLKISESSSPTTQGV
jgi:glycosyltransferase involved in cell wall biosynthesis